jgi:hypothetical protein
LKRETYELLHAARSLKPGEWACGVLRALEGRGRTASEIARGLVRRALEAEPRAGRFTKSAFGLEASLEGCAAPRVYRTGTNRTDGNKSFR